MTELLRLEARLKVKFSGKQLALTVIENAKLQEKFEECRSLVNMKLPKQKPNDFN